MNVFENKYSSVVWETLEGACLLQQAKLPVKAGHKFESTREVAEEWVMRGFPPYEVVSLEAPLWFIRAVRKHYKVVDYNVSGPSRGKWIHTFRHTTELEPWEYGGNISVTIAIRIHGSLIFFKTRD